MSSEELLINRSAEGDNDAFEELMGARLKVVYNYICGRIGSSEDAKDILQDTLLAVWQSLKSYHGHSSLTTWILSIARRKIADFYRRAYRFGLNANEELAAYAEVLQAEDDFEKIAVKLAAESVVSELGSVEKELIYLVFNAQLSYSEVAELLRLPVGTVKSRMSAIKAKLKKSLSKEVGL